MTMTRIALAALGLVATATLMLSALNPAPAEENKAADPIAAAAVAEPNDPLEGLNRITSGFNRILRRFIIDPIVDGYQAITPDEVQEAVSNVVSNLTEPVTVVSSLLQGDFDNAGTATGRFLVNTTIGLGGMRDEATGLGLKQRREDLGQSLGAHGVPSGPHLVLPVIGPTNFRDAPGDIVIGLLSPLSLGAQAGAGAVEYSDEQDSISAISDNVVDPYIAERDAYEQRRDYVIHNGEKVPLPEIGEIE